MQLEKHMNPSNSWADVAWIVAQDHGIDKLGMSLQRLKILESLSKGSVSKTRMAFVAGCKPEELVKFIMPPLMADTPDQDPLVTVTTKGYTITDSGKDELRKRGMLPSVHDPLCVKMDDNGVLSRTLWESNGDTPSTTTSTYLVDKMSNGLRVDVFVSRKTKSKRSGIKSELIRVNGNPVELDQKLSSGDLVEINNVFNLY
jgi:hypothetical protein